MQVPLDSSWAIPSQCLRAMPMKPVLSCKGQLTCSTQLHLMQQLHETVTCFV